MWNNRILLQDSIMMVLQKLVTPVETRYESIPTGVQSYLRSSGGERDFRRNDDNMLRCVDRDEGERERVGNTECNPIVVYAMLYALCAMLFFTEHKGGK